MRAHAHIELPERLIDGVLLNDGRTEHNAVGTLAMTREQFNSALAAGRAMSSAPPTVDPQRPRDVLVDAAGMETRTGVPASWWMTQARERRIPFQKIGRRVRFDPVAVLESDAFRRRALTSVTPDIGVSMGT